MIFFQLLNSICIVEALAVATETGFHNRLQYALRIVYGRGRRPTQQGKSDQLSCFSALLLILPLRKKKSLALSLFICNPLSKV